MLVRSAVLCSLAAAAPVLGGELVWQTEMNFQVTLGPSSRAPGHFGEIADDFEATALIDRVIADGMDAGCFNCPAPETLGVYVRFYEWTESGPGQLQAERFVGADDPNFMYDHELPQELDIRLETPFEATGRHFVSVQMAFGDAPGVYDSWFWWQANANAPLLSPIYYRTSADGAWGPYLDDFTGQPVNCDVAISIFGRLPGDEPSDDPCGEWSLIDTPAPQGSIRSVLTDVGVVAADDVWVVGNFTEYLSQ
ncbi:MAG TPA: hypothetical protein VFF69_12810, partial [Phycisphaerales bacterium]|nr:hypothetical protein [Phycisphaerales bacterium]